jgi:hypothetical protein
MSTSEGVSADNAEADGSIPSSPTKPLLEGYFWFDQTRWPALAPRLHHITLRRAVSMTTETEPIASPGWWLGRWCGCARRQLWRGSTTPLVSKGLSRIRSQVGVSLRSRAGQFVRDGKVKGIKELGQLTVKFNSYFQYFRNRETPELSARLVDGEPCPVVGILPDQRSQGGI